MNFRFVFAPIASLSLVLLFGVCPTLAETITIPITPGALDGANGADGVGGPGGDGAPGGNASAIAIAPADFNNTAITTGGNGGTGGNGNPHGAGGAGGAATAVSATSVASGDASSNSSATGGSGGSSGNFGIQPPLSELAAMVVRPLLLR
jgi:hypothetical protein